MPEEARKMKKAKKLSDHDVNEIVMFMEYLRDKEQLSTAELVVKWQAYMGLSDAEVDAYIRAGQVTD